MHFIAGFFLLALHVLSIRVQSAGCGAGVRGGGEGRGRGKEEGKEEEEVRGGGICAKNYIYIHMYNGFRFRYANLTQPRLVSIYCRWSSPIE